MGVGQHNAGTWIKPDLQNSVQLCATLSAAPLSIAQSTAMDLHGPDVEDF